MLRPPGLAAGPTIESARGPAYGLFCLPPLNRDDSAAVRHELHTKDYGSAVKFYQNVFDRDTDIMRDAPEFRYTTLGAGDSAKAGIMGRPRPARRRAVQLAGLLQCGRCRRVGRKGRRPGRQSC